MLKYLLALSMVLPALCFADSVAKPDETLGVVSSKLPLCVDDGSAIAKIEDTMTVNKNSDAKYSGYREALQSDSDVELMARLVYSETLAANCPSLQSQILPRIAAVIGNRAKIHHGGIRSVVFQRDQFASSLNVYTESRYRDFLCPKDPALWALALDSAGRTMSGKDSLLSKDTVNYFLYQHSPRWKAPSWKLAEDTAGSTAETAKCVRFFHVPNWK